LKKYIDISLPINSELPIWPGSQKIEFKENLSIKNGDIANESSINISLHTGTHIDAPSHFIDDGLTIDKIPIAKLIGLTFVACIKNINTITAETLDSSSIPQNVKRLLLLTDNTKLWMKKSAKFNENYVAISIDAAQWIVDRKIELIGIDYLSIQKYNDSPDTHIILLNNGVVILEGLNLSNVSEGWYELVCLPLKFEGIDGSPARAILINKTDQSHIRSLII